MIDAAIRLQGYITDAEAAGEKFGGIKPPFSRIPHSHDDIKTVLKELELRDAEIGRRMSYCARLKAFARKTLAKHQPDSEIAGEAKRLGLLK